MQAILKQLLLLNCFLLFMVSPIFGFGGSHGMSADVKEPEIGAGISALTIKVRQQQSGETLQVPLFSESHQQMPVASVAGEPITLKEFSLELARMHSNMAEDEKPTGQSFTKLLDRMISIKLVKQEALNIGFDRTPEVQSQVKNFALKMMIKQLLAENLGEIQVAEDEVEELYQQMAIEAKLLTYRFTDKADAEVLRTAVAAGGDFKVLADEAVAAGKAEGGEEPEFAHLNDLFPAVAKAVYGMQPGDVSEIFKGEKGHLLFQLQDRRVYEDPEIRLMAANRLVQQQATKKQYQYLESIVDKYTTIDEEAEAALDFEKIVAEKPGIQGREVFDRLSKDQRPLAIVSNGRETVELSVADLAEDVKKSMYHGVDREIDGASLNSDKEIKLWNALVSIAGRLEAQAQGIDERESFKEQVAKFEERTLFDTFMAKAVVPGIKVPEQDAKDYYAANQEEYTSPLMLKLTGLAFTNRTAAEEAYRKLKAGSDFKWVSANSSDLAEPDHRDLLNFSGNLLSLSALPEGLRKQVETAMPGSVYLYEDPGKLVYALQVGEVFPPQTRPYQEVRQEIGKIVYAQKINQALAHWVEQLKEAYETEIYLVQDQI